MKHIDFYCKKCGQKVVFYNDEDEYLDIDEFELYDPDFGLCRYCAYHLLMKGLKSNSN